jgi:formate hydrogenlyase subunit 3/multisubunit Na+/H+ antiporter MnhD subunit
MVLVPLAALPALALAAYPGLTSELPWVLLGMRLGVDETGALFLLLAGILWTASGLFAQGYLADDSAQARFQFFFLLTCAGNLGVIVALDAASFYLFFALMTFAAYGLIVHDGSEEARRAGRVYLVLAVIGEVLLLAAMLLITAALGNADLRELPAKLALLPERDLIVGLILVGFGIKMGAVPLHVWLPLAHPCAPTPASAVLSGIIIKAGLVGWLRFLPLGELTLPEWGTLCLAVGMGSAFYAALVGLFQSRPKTVLAYSSISQMGLVTALLGIALAAPGSWPLLLATLLLFSLHHGLAKAALFLGTGVTGRGGNGSGWGLVLPALALVGAPLTSGILAKLLLKDTSALAPGDWASWLAVLLPLSSLVTGLLMARFLYLAWPRQHDGRVSIQLWLPWVGLLAAVALLPWWWAEARFPLAFTRTLALDLATEKLWTLVIVGLLAVTTWGSWRAEGFHLRLPEGDILYFFSRAAGLFSRGYGYRNPVIATEVVPIAAADSLQSGWMTALLGGSERNLRYFGVSIFLSLSMVLLALLMWWD